jgi:uncharacterized protein (TIGR01777 family)
MRSVILAGGTGQLGRLLVPYLTTRGWRVSVLSRHDARIPHAEAVTWNGRTRGLWTDALENVHALVNLAGRSVNCRYTPVNRRAMMDSRIDSTRILGEAVAACKHPPRVWLNSSTATIYRHTLGPPHDEYTGEIGATPAARDAFSLEVATAWEHAFFSAPTRRTRKVAMRTAIVLGTDPENMVAVLRRLTRFGLGGGMGGGRQYVSWIHALDFCRAVELLLDTETLRGPVNLAAPNPVTNAEMMRTFRDLLHAPFGLPAPRPLLELGAFFLRTETELVLKSRRVISRKLAEAGFRFRFPDFRAALAYLLDSGPSPSAAGVSSSASTAPISRQTPSVPSNSAG